MYVNAIKQVSQSRRIKVDVKRDINYVAERRGSKEKDELMRYVKFAHRTEQRIRVRRVHMYEYHAYIPVCPCARKYVGAWSVHFTGQ